MKPSWIKSPSLPLLACLAMLGGCSTARMDSQWIDRSFHDGLAAGTRVFVSCETGDDSLRRLCEDAWAERMRTEGITVVRSYAPGGVPGDAVGNAERIERAARATGANATIRMKLAVGSYSVFQPGPQVGFGIGGGSGGGGFSFGGIGVSLPIGGGASPRQEMASSTTLTDLGRGTVVWSGGARTQVDGDALARVSALTRVTVDAMRKAGVIR
ncbi:hypothetical protein [Thauera sp.]|uniref:hypothetical protein n=1 Tax=Thauera sp. TaxID=1905334 RepID=UPI002A3643C6|nr:hypothetical protein [Thauera sp.]